LSRKKADGHAPEGGEMATTVWMVLAVTAMAAIFAGCVIGVTAALRVVENARARRGGDGGG
jgi:hypothetical protein